MKTTETRKIKAGNLFVGGDKKVTIQSMTNTKTKNIDDTIKQINHLYTEGAEIVRVSIFDNEDSQPLKTIPKLKQLQNRKLVQLCLFKNIYWLICKVPPVQPHSMNYCKYILIIIM